MLFRSTSFSVHDLAERVGHSLTGKYPTGVFSDSARLLRRRTKAKGWTTYGLPPSLKNIPLEYFLRYARKSRTAAHLEHARPRRILRRALVPLGTRLPSSSELLRAADRVVMYELRTAGAYRPALPVVLVLRCDNILWGTTASQVKVLYGQGAQYGSMICFCGADLRALAFLLLYHPEFSHKMRISSRSNKIFQRARRVILSGGVSHLAEIENVPVGHFPGRL